VTRWSGWQAPSRRTSTTWSPTTRGTPPSCAGAASGNPALREIYEEARAALTDRIFETAGQDGLTGFGVVDTPAVRLMVRGWSAMTEEIVLTWARDGRGVPKDELLGLLTAALPAVLSAT
jgi:hypothetical protein